MNRKIKLRAWSKSGEYFKPITEDMDYMAFFTGKGGSLQLWDNGNPCDEKDIVWMLYSGIKDIKKKGIYESDIVKCEYGVGEVIFHVGCFMVKWLDDKEANMGFLYETDFEVIGNIYENPELLNL